MECAVVLDLAFFPVLVCFFVSLCASCCTDTETRTLFHDMTPDSVCPRVFACGFVVVYACLSILT